MQGAEPLDEDLSELDGVGKQTINQWMNLAKSRERFFKDVVTDQSLYEQPVASLAERYGVTTRTVQRWLQKYRVIQSKECGKVHPNSKKRFTGDVVADQSVCE